NVMIATGYEFGNRIASIKGFSDPMYIYRLDSFKSVNGLKLEWLNPIKKLKAASQINIRITLSNIAAYAVAGNKLYINYSFIKTRKEFQSSSDPVSITDQVLSPGYKKEFAIDLKMPIAPGSYRLIFSILQSPFAGTFASPFYDVDVG
ncbi:MAG: hypothetical protein ACJ749_10180, partial [Flavisolibacter sp.]